MDALLRSRHHPRKRMISLHTLGVIIRESG
jgi:hypothetical protein